MSAPAATLREEFCNLHGGDGGRGDAETLLEVACRHSRTLREAVAIHGESTLDGYLASSCGAFATDPARLADLVDSVRRCSAPLLGTRVADLLEEEILANPVALTTNHHGVDFFAQSVQGTLIFSLRRRRDGSPVKVVPVFACGAVPLDNLTYPQGMLVYGAKSPDLKDIPRRLPVFSNRYRRQLVSVAPAIDREMLGRAEHRALRLRRTGEVSPRLCDTIVELLREEYGADEILSRDNYSDQSVALNQRLWRRLLTDERERPELVYIELEKITADLLERDLARGEGITHLLLFDPELRGQVLNVLDDARACWNRTGLVARLTASAESSRPKISATACGTMFFWGITDSGRRVPLLLDSAAQGDARLRGIDDRGRPWSWPFTPDALIEGLREQRLLPSLFTCFLEVSLTRGVACLGGYHQTKYLPVIQQGIAEAMARVDCPASEITRIAAVTTRGYLAGMQATMQRTDDRRLVPAGPLEIIAAGGLGAGDVMRLRNFRVRDAHIASLTETIPDLVTPQPPEPNWRSDLARSCAGLLRGGVVLS